MAIAYAHGPSLDHIHRADHWWYLADISQFDGWWDTVWHTLSYSRTRDVETGDTTLFRPLLYVLLATQTALLEHHTSAYQATSLVLHFLVCAALFRSMRLGCRFAGGYANHSATLWFLGLSACCYFAVNIASAEAVIWAHLAGYLLFYFVTLVSLNLVLRDGLDQDRLRPPAWRIPAVWCAMLLAGFLYEYGQLYAAVLGVLVCVFRWNGSPLGERARIAGAFLFIPVICQGVNIADRAGHAESIAQDAERSAMYEVFRAPLDPEAYEHAYTLARFTLVAPLYPLGWEPALKSERMHMTMRRFTDLPYTPLLRWSHTFGFLAIIATFIVGGLRLYRARLTIPILLTLLAFLFLFLFGIFAVRVLPRGSGALPGSPYYTYWPNALMLAIMVVTIASSWSNGLVRAGAFAATLAFFGGALLMSGMTRELNSELARSIEGRRGAIEAIANIVEEHSGDFHFEYEHPDSIWTPMNAGVPWPELVFVTRFDPEAERTIRVANGTATLVE